MDTNPYGLAALWTQGDLVIKSVAVILLLMSVASWYVIVTRSWQAFRLRAASRRMGNFWHAHSFEQGLSELRTGDNAPNPFINLALEGKAAAEHHAQQHGRNKGECDADEEEDVDVEGRLDLRDIRPETERDRRQIGGDGLDVGLAEEEGEARAEDHQGDTDRDVVDLGELADPAVQEAEEKAAEGGRERTRPGGACVVGDGIAAHRADDERGIDTAKPLTLRGESEIAYRLETVILTKEGDLTIKLPTRTEDRLDLKTLQDLRSTSPVTATDAPLSLLVPSFLLSEIQRAFEIGFMIFLPFLIIDLVVAAILMSMGMMMVPPAVVSLPFKLVFFVVADGWALISGALVRSYF